MGTLVGTIAFIVLILFAIFFHELGHFLTARWSGIKCSRFFLGFGPTVWSFRRGRPETVEDPGSGELVERPETEYGIKALPLGGFVKIVGMSPFEDIPSSDQPRSFAAAPAWKRAIVLSAGSVTHFITAFIVLIVIFSIVGIPDPDRPTLRVEQVVTEVDGEPAPAHAAGIEPGDTILAVDGRSLEGWEDLRSTIRINPETPLDLTVRGDDGTERTVTLTPAAIDEEGQTIGFMGVMPAMETERVNPVTATARTPGIIGDVVVSIGEATPRVFSPENLGIVPGEEPGDERPVSIVGAGRIAADLAAQGQVAMFLWFFVTINIFIGLFNMLPLPPLDGGHLLLLGIEKLRGNKPVHPKAVLPVTALVFALLVALGLLLVFQDIVSPVQLPGP